MTALKKNAVGALDALYHNTNLPSEMYELLRGALTEIELLRDRDEELEELWDQFEDIPMNQETECIEAPFFGWGVGIGRDEIWHWFDQRHSKGVAYLLYHGQEDYVPETKRLYGLSKLCFGCESTDCQFNCGGQCRFAMVHEVKPSISEHSGCLSYEYRATDLW